MTDDMVRVGRWEQIPEILRERLLDVVAKEIANVAADPLIQHGTPITNDPYVLYIWDCARLLRNEVTEGRARVS